MPLSKLSPAEQNNYLHLVLDSTIEGLYAVDTTGHTTLCNAAFLKMLGFASLDEVIGKRLHDLIHHSHPDGSPYPHDDCPIYRAAHEGKGSYVPYELFFRPDGTSFPVEYRAEPIIDNGILRGAVCTFTDISDKIETERQLNEARRQVQEASERFNVALDAGMILGTFVWDVPNDLIRGDGRFARTFSVDPVAMDKGTALSDVVQNIHPDDLPHVETLINQALAGGEFYNAEYRVKQDDGWLWIQASGRVSYDLDRKPLFFYGVLSNIHARKSTDVNYQRLQDQLQLAQEAGGIGLFYIDIANDHIHGTPEFYRIFGVSDLNETSPTVFQNAALAADKDKVSNAATRQAGNIVLNAEYRIKRYDTGEIRWILRRSRFIHDAQGKPERLVGAVVDITDRKETEINLDLSHQRYQGLFNSIDQGFCVVDMVFDANDHPHDYIFIEVNPAFAVHTGLQDAVGQTMKTLNPNHEQHWFDLYGNVARTGEPIRFTNYGLGRWFEVYAFKVSGAENRVAMLFYDTTEERAAAEALIEARNAAEAANIAKTEFLANMSHEIRTPMNAIIGLANILSASHPLTQRQKDFIKTLQMSADSLLALINDLLDISKIEARTVELEDIPFSLSQLVQEVISMMAVRVKEKGLTFTLDGDCVGQRVSVGDPTRLRQIILNLCSNAIKFTHDGGVHITMQCQDHVDPAYETIAIAVRDTGIGIPADKVDTIFTKFVQADTSINRKYGGTGLGLAITKTLTEIMGGTIAVDSQVGQGSTFTITVPLKRATAAEAADFQQGLPDDTATMTAATSNRTRILLVEDYAPNVLVATTVLDQFGYDTDVASNGLEAIDAVKTRRHALVLMDVQMHGMNGLEATRLIRAHEKQNSLRAIPIIGMTAHALAGDKERCLGAGMTDYIPKPFNPDQLHQKIKDALDHAPQAA